jgi:stress-induced-phosphoprotein 1
MSHPWFMRPPPLPPTHTREGNAAFKAGDYSRAIEKYGEAIAIDPTNHTYWSNRAASYAGLEDWANSRDDAKQCIGADKSFVKGYFRMATAQKNLGDFDGARETLVRGLAVEPRNADLKKNLKVCALHTCVFATP